jgi:hypothetical protein
MSESHAVQNDLSRLNFRTFHCKNPSEKSKGDRVRGEIHFAQDDQTYKEHQLSHLKIAQAQLLSSSYQIHRAKQEHFRTQTQKSLWSSAKPSSIKGAKKGYWTSEDKIRTRFPD